MSAEVVFGGVGVLLGALAVALPSIAVNRKLAEERDDWRRKTGVLVGALRPFAPIRMRVGKWPKPCWVCPSCARGGLLGSGSHDEGEAADEAREHFIEEHLTRENLDRAGRTLREVLGERWWKP